MEVINLDLQLNDELSKMPKGLLAVGGSTRQRKHNVIDRLTKALAR